MGKEDQPTEKTSFEIPRLGISGEVDLPVIETVVGGPSMDGEIFTVSDRKVPFNSPRFGMRELRPEKSKVDEAG